MDDGTGPVVRWIQRYSSLKLVVSVLAEGLTIRDCDKVQRAGIIHYFSMAFELSWNVVKDYLESEGFEGVSSPRAAVKKGFEQGLIVDGHGWIKGLEDRKFTSLTYNEDIAVEVEGLVRTRYISLFHELLEEPVKRLP